jgi:hypothetical protein
MRHQRQAQSRTAERGAELNQELLDRRSEALMASILALLLQAMFWSVVLVSA